MYVDDCLAGADDIGAAVELQQSLDKMMERGGFNLTKWASNSKEVLSHIAEQEQAESITIDFNASEPGKVLGMSGNTVEHYFKGFLPYRTNHAINDQSENVIPGTLAARFTVGEPFGR